MLHFRLAYAIVRGITYEESQQLRKGGVQFKGSFRIGAKKNAWSYQAFLKSFERLSTYQK